MRKLTYSFPAKAAAVFLLVLLALGGGVSLFCILASYAFYFYRVHSGDLAGALAQLRETGYLTLREEQYINDNYDFFSFVFNARKSSVWLLIFYALLAFAVFIFLMCAAGHRKGVKGIYLSFFDRIPFDALLATAALAESFLLAACVEITRGWYPDDLFINLVFVAAVCVVMLLVLLAVLYSFSARLKAGKWWRGTAIYTVLALICRLVSKGWSFTRRVFRAIRIEWRAALVAAGFVLLLFFAVMLLVNHDTGLAALIFVILSLTAFCVSVLGAWQFGKLRDAGERLAAGKLDYQVDTEKMYFDFKRHGENLNSIAAGMSLAVDQRMRSERLKTELITNVSHDIKTPLTSIVNYVDLLRKPHTEEQERQYLDVLARQSDKLRRLTLDLVEASKASTGSLPTELAPTSADELINQAVAEYAERFRQCRLEPVISLPEKHITVLADGRHLWRVLDNLFNNAVKYAQPGTRVYIDAKRLDGEAVISVKNISRDRLNVSSEELMERFVRGDQSRHTEGSGLGLSIARSLTELMGGRFGIVVDGDLFKAEIYLKLL